MRSSLPFAAPIRVPEVDSVPLQKSAGGFAGCEIEPRGAAKCPFARGVPKVPPGEPPSAGDARYAYMEGEGQACTGVASTLLSGNPIGICSDSDCRKWLYGAAFSVNTAAGKGVSKLVV